MNDILFKRLLISCLILLFNIIVHDCYSYSNMVIEKTTYVANKEVTPIYNYQPLSYDNPLDCPELTIQYELLSFGCNYSYSLEITGVENAIYPLSYQWSNGSTYEGLVEIEPGIYTVTVTDANGCTVIQTFELSPLYEVNSNLIVTNENSYGANDGYASVNPSGGHPPYNIMWSTGDTTNSISGLEPGNYSVIIEDATYCYQEESFTIMPFVCPELSVFIDIVNESCSTQCSGSLEILDVVNGVPPYSYQWSNGQSGNIITNLCQGYYSVDLSDSKNCTFGSEFYVNLATKPTTVVSTVAETMNNGNNGSATVSATGGYPPFTYLWSNGQTSNSVSGLSPGWYYITVTDSKSCSKVDSAFISEFICPSLAIQVNVDSIDCFNECNGYIEITSVTNASYPVTYDWTNYGSYSESFQNDLCSGTYTVIVSDSKNCSVTANYILNQPAPLISNCFVTDETSYNADDGTITCISSGGVAPYTYHWSNGDTTSILLDLSPGLYVVTVTDSHQCVHIDSAFINEIICPNNFISSQITDASCFGSCDGSIIAISLVNCLVNFNWSTGSDSNSISNLCAGNYTLTVTCSSNCIDTLFYVINEPAEIIFSVDSIQNIYENSPGFIYISVPNEAEYEYIWTGPGGYTSDQRNLDNLNLAGCYTLLITDNITNCIKTDSFCISDFTGIEDLIGTVGIKIYPNPANNELYIDLKDFNLVNPQFSIFNTSGSVAGQFNIIDSDINNIYNIQTSQLIDGVYYIRIMDQKNTIIKKFIIQR